MAGTLSTHESKYVTRNKNQKSLTSLSSEEQLQILKLHFEGNAGQLNGVSFHKETGMAVGKWEPILTSGPWGSLGEHVLSERSPLNPSFLKTANPVPQLDGQLMGIAKGCEWAVGYKNILWAGLDQEQVPLIYQKVGLSWKEIPILPVPSDMTFSGWQPLQCLNSVTGSRKRAWAVGDYGDGWSITPKRRLILSWDGTSWALVPRPPLGWADRLLGVTVTAGMKVWAVGHWQASKFSTLIEHANGYTYQIVHSPNIKDADHWLFSVSFASDSDGWAVGSYTTTSPSFKRPLAMHFNGSIWKIVPTTKELGELRGVYCISSNDVWAVGTRYGKRRPLIMHWDGTKWTSFPTPLFPYYPVELHSVEGVSSSNVWAVGTKWNGFFFRTLAMRWDGKSWSVFHSD